MHSPSAVPNRASVGDPGVVLAIDYGRRRIGLALSDALGTTARPLATWTRSNRRRDLARLRDLCREHGVTQIIVGRPLHLDGTQSEMASEAARFGERVSQSLNLPVEFVDERLTSWDAHETIRSVRGKSHVRSRHRRSGARRTLDDVAAAVILREYLSRAARAGC
jgi:putative Holliday junction resolvase